MTTQNPHFGSSFEGWLDETGLREEVTAAAVKAVIAGQIADETTNQHSTKTRSPELTQPSHTKFDRQLDPNSGSTTVKVSSARS